MGQARDEAGNIWETDAQGNAVRLVEAAPAQGGQMLTLPQDPRAAAEEARKAAAEGRSNQSADIAVSNANLSQTTNIADAYNADPTVKSYRVAIQSLGQALNTGEGPQADLALTYAFAKAMDPDSVVRESEQGMVTSSQPWFTATVEQVKKQFGMDGAGNFTPEARDQLRRQILNSVDQRQRVYDARREYFQNQAAALGVDPEIVLGAHDKAPYLQDLEVYNARLNAPDAGGIVPDAADGEVLTGTVTDDRPRGPGDYQSSYLGQGMSGVNEGLAGTLGAPVDLATMAMNLVPQGLNALTNSNLPMIENPAGGSEWFKDAMGNWAIYDQTDDPTKQFTRRVGESLGAAAVPLGGAAGSLANAGRGAAIAAGGGVGAATAQQAFPGNPWAEMGGEMLGGGLTGLGAMQNARKVAQREIEGQIPTIPELQEQASGLYRRAEQNGVSADPMMTQQFADDFRDTLRREGQLGPAGRISDAPSNTNKAHNLIEQYAGQPMRPTEMDTIRRVISDGRSSPDASDQRLSRILLDQFDDFVRPLAPEFDQARDVSSRYLQAQDLEQARELAGASASQFTGSGFENALRREYRALDRGTIKGREWFEPDVSEAIQNVSRGTTLSNLARGVGKLAPTGVVSGGIGMGVPSALGMSALGPAGAAIGPLVGGIGAGGRMAATNMGIRNADIAELTARNGGAIEQAGVPEAFTNLAAILAAVRLPQYQTEQRNAADR